MNIAKLIESKVLENREPDGLLHASSHLVSNLRHTLLSFVPDIPFDRPPDVVSQVRMQTGTLWHSQLEHWLSGLPAMVEVNLTPWMPEGWSGRADALVWDDERSGFRLHDLKTIKGDAIVWKKKNGASEAHIWQTSLYWWAAWQMGLPMVDEITIIYLPMNQAPGAEMIEINFEPVSFNRLSMHCGTRKIFLDEFKAVGYDLSTLPPGPGRVQKKYKGTEGCYDVKLVPHWEAQFCPYPLPYCDCSTLKTEKIGHYDPDGIYIPRKGREHIEPTV